MTYERVGETGVRGEMKGVRGEEKVSSGFANASPNSDGIFANFGVRRGVLEVEESRFCEELGCFCSNSVLASFF